MPLTKEGSLWNASAVGEALYFTIRTLGSVMSELLSQILIKVPVFPLIVEDIHHPGPEDPEPIPNHLHERSRTPR
jgi:hypothetical protein